MLPHLARATRFGVLLLLTSATAAAAPPWVDRPITLPRHDFAFDVGVGVAHAVGRFRDPTGPGMNMEAAFGITDRVEVGLRMGFRLNDDARATGADAFARTLWTETYGTRGDVVANPEARFRWRAYGGRVVEVGLDGRVFLPVEQGSRMGLMFGVPLAFHVGSSVRIDMGVYTPVVFYDSPAAVFSVPGYFWFQVSPKVWLGPMTALRWVDPGAARAHAELLLGFGLGVQVASIVDLKTMFLFPQINRDEGARTFGAGFGVQIRIE